LADYDVGFAVPKEVAEERVNDAGRFLEQTHALLKESGLGQVLTGYENP